MPIHIWIQSPAAIAFARTLLHSLWQAAFTAFTLAIGLRFIRGSRLRYIAACAALCAIVLMSIGTFAVIEPNEALQLSTERAVSLRPSSNAGVVPDGFGLSSSSSLERFLPWVTLFWLSGSLIFTICRVAGWVGLRRLRHRAVSDVPEAWSEALDRNRLRMGISKPIALLESGLARVPLVIGHLRPVILVPMGLLAGLPADQVELIMMHEIAHIRRCDYLVNMLQTFVESVMFYNPGVWWISSVIRTERENCCDDVVVESTNQGPRYASALAALEEIRSDQREVVMAATGGNVLKRVRRILRQPEPQASALVPVLGVLALIAVIAAAMQMQARQAVFPNPYANWVNEDVVYIITSQERATFLGLSTDAERNQFIEQFWLRRDPTPGSPQNEFKEEHYARIAYANGHFGSAVPLPEGEGWRTDRGRIYIMYGKPDELESHPSGGTYDRPADQGGGTIKTFPFEIWRYRSIQGIGRDVLLEFVDQNGLREYKLSVDPAAKRQLLDGK